MSRARRDLPTGTVTFLFTDIEGSTRLLHELGASAYAETLAAHRRLLRDAFTRHGGVEIDTQGDAFFYAFPTAPGALAAAREAQHALAGGPVRVRMGLHTGTPHLTDEGYVGADVHLGARIAAAGHGGQALLSASTRGLAGEGSDLGKDVSDLGEHRLKDIQGPVRIFQLGAERFPPLRTISNTNLPRPASSFVGRAREVDDVVALLRNGTRLLTLTGPGGSGKTRLAIEAAAELVPTFKAGVFWVGLAPLRDPGLVTAEIAETLGARKELSAHIKDRELLLLLDNFEQVIGAARELSALVEACPNLRLLVTSRERLRVRGEVEYPVLPLADSEAVDLFCARTGLPPDDTTRALCRALDDLPLAIELAAARASALSPRQILQRLGKRLDLLKAGRDADPRQQTLRTTIEWSYQLLSQGEQRLFARLSAFAGGCTLESAEAVAEADLDTLQSLIDKSLLRRTGERFWMLETIREFAAERLEASGAAGKLRRRHAEHFLALAAEAEPHLRRDAIDWLDRLAREHDNLRTSLDHLDDADDHELLLQLGVALSRFWYLKSHLLEGRRRLDRALQVNARETLTRAKALSAAAVMALNLGDAVAARARAEEALALSRTLGHPWETAYATLMVGNAMAEEKELEKARPVLAESLRLFQELGDEHYALIARSNLAWVTGDLGDPAQERDLLETNLRIARATGNERIAAAALAQIAMLMRNEERLEDGLAMIREALRIEHRRGNTLEVAINLGRLASILAPMGRAQQAATLLASSESLMAQVGASIPFWAGQRNERTLADIHKQLDEAILLAAQERGRVLAVDEAVEVALSEP